MYKQFTLIAILFLFILSFQQTVAQNDEVPGYDKSWEIKPGVFKVRKDMYYGVVSKEGAVIIPCEFNQIWDLDKNGNVKVLKGNKIGLYNIEGVNIVRPEYDQIWSFEKGKAKVLKNGKIGYVDKMGNEIIPPVYSQIWGFENGKARVLKNGKIGYVDEAGHEVIPPEYNQIWEFENGRAKVMKNGRIGYIDEAGREVIPPEYNQIWEFENGRAKVMRNGKIGYIDAAGHEVIPPEYNQIWEFENGKAKAVLNGEVIWIDSKGSVIETTTEKTTVNDTLITATQSVEVQDEYVLSDSVFNDSTVVRIWSNRIEIVKDKEKVSTRTSDRNNYRQHRDKRRRFKGHWTGMNVGYNNMITSSGSFNYPDEYKFMEMNAGKSVGVAVNPWQQSIKLQRRGNIGLVTGLGIEWNNYRFDSQYILERDENGNTSYYETTEPVKKNKLTTIYMNAPLLLEFQIPIGKNRYLLYLSGGAIGGLRLGSYTRVVYVNDAKQKNKDHFNLTQWRYGATVRFGYRAINFFADYYFSPLFEKNRGPELYQVSAGIFISLDY